MTANLKRLVRAYKMGDLYITPVVDRWLVEHPEGLVLTDELLDTFRQLTSKHPRDRSNSWAASARGTCLRRQVFQYIGVPVPNRLDPRLQNLFNDGAWRHLRWQMMLLDAGLLEDVEVPVYSKRYNMVGTMDGIGDGWGFELKGIYSLSGVSTGPYDSHLLQVHSYFLAKPDLERFSLVYEDKRTQDYREFLVERDPMLMKKVRQELMALKRAVSGKELPEVLEDCKDAKGTTYQQCPYKAVCLDIQDWDEAKNASY